MNKQLNPLIIDNTKNVEYFKTFPKKEIVVCWDTLLWLASPIVLILVLNLCTEGRGSALKFLAYGGGEGGLVSFIYILFGIGSLVHIFIPVGHRLCPVSLYLLLIHFIYQNTDQYDPTHGICLTCWGHIFRAGAFDFSIYHVLKSPLFQILVCGIIACCVLVFKFFQNKYCQEILPTTQTHEHEVA